MSNLNTIITFFYFSSIVGVLVAAGIVWYCLWQLHRNTAGPHAQRWIKMILGALWLGFLQLFAYLISGLYLLAAGRGSALGIAITMLLMVALVILTGRMMYQTRQIMKVPNSSNE